MVFGHLSCTYRLNWARRISWGWLDERDEIPFGHRIGNSSTDGLMPSTLPLGHISSPQYWIFYEWAGKKRFVCLKLECQSALQNSRPRTFQADIFSHSTMAPASPRTTTEIKWIGFRPPLCTCRLCWVRITFWGWWDEWDDIALQTHNLKFVPWCSEAEHATSRSRRLPTIFNLYKWPGRNILFFDAWMAERGSSSRSPTFQVETGRGH